MLERIVDEHTFYEQYLAHIVNAALEITSRTKTPVRILNTTTGFGRYRVDIIKRFEAEGIGYEFVSADISPSLLSKGYEHLKEELPSESSKVRCVLADARNLEKELKRTPVWGDDLYTFEGRKKIEDILKDPRFEFLLPSYTDGKRNIEFSNESFDMVIEEIPFTSSGSFTKAPEECVRVLKKGGYSIIMELQVEEIHSYKSRLRGMIKDLFKRFPPVIYASMLFAGGISKAKAKPVDRIKRKMDSLLSPVDFFSRVCYNDQDKNYVNYWETVYTGDKQKTSILVHKRP